MSVRPFISEYHTKRRISLTLKETWCCAVDVEGINQENCRFERFLWPLSDS